MQLLRQEFININTAEADTAKKNAFVDYCGCTIADEPSMDILQNFISNSDNPILILDTKTRRIVLSNTAAQLGSDSPIINGEVFEEVFPVIGIDNKGINLIHMNEMCYSTKETEFDWNGIEYRRVEFFKKADSPDRRTLETWKKMIAVMLHRFRSPLTGVSGYLELLKENEADHNRHLDQVYKGIDRVFDIMDELETLHNIPTDHTPGTSAMTNLNTIMDVVLLKQPEEIKERIQYEQPAEPVNLPCSASSLKVILDNLIRNAVDHSTIPGSKITVEVVSDGQIRVHNEGSVIPEDITDNLFYPFITTTADNMGIGLTMALMHARQYGGGIYLSQNDANGVSFNIYFT